MLLRRQIINGFGWNFIIGHFLFILQFLNGVVLARILLPSDFGKIAYITASITLIFILRGLGFDNYLVQCDKNKLSEYGGTAILLNAVLCISICICSIIFSMETMDAETTSIFSILMVSRTIQHIFFSYQNFVTKELLYKKMALLTLIPELISIFVGFCLAISGWGIWSLVWMVVANIFFVVILSLIFSPYSVGPAFSKRALHDIWNYGKFNILNAVTGKSSSNLDNIIVQNFAGYEALGFYNKGFGLSKIFNQFIGNIVLKVIGPLFAKFKGDRRKLSMIYSEVVAAVFRLNLGIYLILFCTARDLIELIYTDKWLPAVPVLRILVLFALLNPLISMSRRFFLNTGRSKPVGISQTLLFFVLLITIFPLVTFYGISGAAISVDLAFGSCFLCFIFHIKRHLDINFTEIFFMPCLIAVSVLLFSYVLSNLISSHELLIQFSIRSLFLGFLYFGILFIFEKKYCFRILKEIKLAY